MHTLTIAGLGLVVGLSYMVDGKGTVKLVIAIVTIRGITWIVKTIVKELDFDKANLINFTGYGFALVSGVKILKNAIVGVEPVVSFCGRIGDFMGGMYNFMDKFNTLIEKLPFIK